MADAAPARDTRASRARDAGTAGPNRGAENGRGRLGTCPISTEGWTRRVHFVREGGGGGGRYLSSRSSTRSRFSSSTCAQSTAPPGGCAQRRLPPLRREQQRAGGARGRGSNGSNGSNGLNGSNGRRGARAGGRAGGHRGLALPRVRGALGGVQKLVLVAARDQAFQRRKLSAPKAGVGARPLHLRRAASCDGQLRVKGGSVCAEMRGAT